MDSSFLTTEMNIGVVGAIARRVPGMMVEPVKIVDDGSVEFGSILTMNDDGKAEGLPNVTASATFSASDFYGICYRTFPVRETQDGKPDHRLTQGVIRNGYVFVEHAPTDTTEIKMGMPVYVVVDTGGTHKKVGQVVGAADGAHTVEIDATFMGSADKNNVIEIAVRI